MTKEATGPIQFTMFYYSMMPSRGSLSTQLTCKYTWYWIPLDNFHDSFCRTHNIQEESHKRTAHCHKTQYNYYSHQIGNFWCNTPQAWKLNTKLNDFSTAKQYSSMTLWCPMVCITERKTWRVPDRHRFSIIYIFIVMTLATMSCSDLHNLTTEFGLYRSHIITSIMLYIAFKHTVHTHTHEYVFMNLYFLI